MLINLDHSHVQWFAWLITGRHHYTPIAWMSPKWNKQTPISHTHQFMTHIYASNGLHKQISENEEQETKRRKKMLNSKFGFLHTHLTIISLLQ